MKEKSLDSSPDRLAVHQIERFLLTELEELENQSSPPGCGALLCFFGVVTYAVTRVLTKDTVPVSPVVDLAVVILVGSRIRKLIRISGSWSECESTFEGGRIERFLERYKNLFEVEDNSEESSPEVLTHFRDWVCSSEFQRFLREFERHDFVWKTFDWDGFFGGHSFQYFSSGTQPTTPGQWNRSIIQKYIHSEQFILFLEALLKFKGMNGFCSRLLEQIAQTRFSPLGGAL